MLIFAWDTHTKTATLVKEYMPGCNRAKFGLAAGLVEDKHHESGESTTSGTGSSSPVLTAAQHELEEECHLVGGTWIELTHDTIMDKYSTTVVNAYLVLDPQPAINPKPLDEEEEIVIVPNVSIAEILRMIERGDMNIVGGWGCLLAIQRLRDLGEIPDNAL